MKFVVGDIVIHKTDPDRRELRVVGFGSEDQVRVFAFREEEVDTMVSLRFMTLAEPLMQFFRFEHLPQALQSRSSIFLELATKLVLDFPRNPERTVALRKLLEAKDAAVRSALYEA